MKTIFNVFALLCLVTGFGGIVCRGEWRLLLVLPVAFGTGIMRNLQWQSAVERSMVTFVIGLPWTKIQPAFRIFASLALFTMTWWALDHFSGASKDFGWIKACWITGLLLQPWHWTGRTLRQRVEAYIALALVVPSVVLILAKPESLPWISLVNQFSLLFVLIVANVIMNRKGVAA